MVHFLTLKGKTATEIHKELVQTYEENCIDVSNMQRKKRDFENNCHVSLEEEQSKQPTDSFTVDNIHHVCEILKFDRSFTLNQIVVCMPSVRCGWSTIYIIICDVL